MSDKVGDMLSELRILLDRATALNAELTEVNKQRSAVEWKLKASMSANGLDKIANDCITVSTKDETVASYEPEHWADLVAWAVAHDATHIIQRRLSSKPIVELAVNGEPIPDFINLQTITRLNVRRK